MDRPFSSDSQLNELSRTEEAIDENRRFPCFS